MSRFIAVLIIFMIVPLAGCNSAGYWPTYPTGGEYGDGGGSGYNPYDPPYYDTGPDWSRDAVGEWEGFMWEDWRSDGRPLSKKIVAMRVNFTRATYNYSGRHEFVKIDVLVDGRPAASKETEITQYGQVSLASYKSSIDFRMTGRFRYDSGDGDIELTWDEKVYNPWTGYTDTYTVDLGGNYEVGRVHHGLWADAWALFDTYGEGIFDLDDTVWETATSAGVANMAEQEEIQIRQPIQ